MAVNLAQAPTAAGLVLEDASLDPITRRRLDELGFRPGRPVLVVNRGAGGAVVVGAGRLRLAIDKTTASAISVAPKSAKATPNLPAGQMPVPQTKPGD